MKDLGKGYGFPSSHSQFMGYWFIFSCLFLHDRIYVKHTIVKQLIIVFALLISLAVCYSRIHLNYHSQDQVLVGLLLGFMFGYIWYHFAYHQVEKLTEIPLVAKKLHRLDQLIMDQIRFKNEIKTK